MTWLKLDDNFPDHPKVLALSSDSLRWFHVRAMAYAARYNTRGEITPAAFRALNGKPKMAEALVEALLWDTTSRGGWAIHDFEIYNPPKKAPEEVALVRAVAGRLGGIKSGEARQAKRASKTEANLLAASEAPARPNASKEAKGASAPRPRTRGICPEDVTRWEGEHPTVDIPAMVRDYENWKGSAGHHDKVLGFENQLREEWRLEKFRKKNGRSVYREEGIFSEENLRRVREQEAALGD